MNNPVLTQGILGADQPFSAKAIKNKYRPHVGVHKNALLMKYQWESIDAAVVDVMRQPVVGVTDLISAGLVNNLPDIGYYLSTYEQLGDMGAAAVTMSLSSSNVTKDRVTFTPQSIPVPVISKPFFYDGRSLVASRRSGGLGLDVTGVRTATIKVREALEDILFQGASIQLGAYVIQGYTNATNRISDTATNFGGGDFGTDGNGHKTITGMIKALQAKGFYGPYGCYVSPTQYSQLLALTGVNLTETQLSVILRTIPGLQFVKRSDRISDGGVVVVQLTQEVVDLTSAMPVTAIQWDEEGGAELGITEFRVIAIAAPRIKFDVNLACGVCHATGA